MIAHNRISSDGYAMGAYCSDCGQDLAGICLHCEREGRLKAAIARFDEADHLQCRLQNAIIAAFCFGAFVGIVTGVFVAANW